MSEPTSAPVNTVTWWELPVTDLDQAKSFYGAVFGWTFTPFGEGYEGILNGSEMIGGLWQAPEQATSDGIRVYVNVADLEATLAAAEAAGGTVKNTREEVGGDMGWWAQIVDPGGRLVGLCTDNAAT
ncbi:VOC family protein [Occultella kanbiaonis]|uniref:VOC family protein n=1 Tax=Occultella kanbiaonis TaxID=2675754 RepID=UPI0012B766AA|nr:VOC family protein [Occultella kanbiaonis]